MIAGQPTICFMWRITLGWLALVWLAACENTTYLATSAFGLTDAAVDAFVPRPEAGLALCDGKPCACDDGEDNDGDNLVDGFDGECTGPYDQDESSFATGEPEGNPKCSDCFFDGNSGSNDDGCAIATNCLTIGSVGDAPGACNKSCITTEECVGNCKSRTPNGCDCFGCCQVTSGRTTYNVLLKSTCSLDPTVLDDPAKCPPCDLARECFNPCGECELCPGRTINDLPSQCFHGGRLNFDCEEGARCDSAADCGGRAYCVYGCCVPLLQ
jgi:hypothetical protein